MNNSDKKYLLDRLAESHAAIQNTLEGVDLELRVYSDTDWRVRDILGHLATWDREVTKSLRAFLVGSEYTIPDMDGDETEFNEGAVLDQRKLSTQQILEEWKGAREDFKAAISDIPVDRFPGDLLYPWGDERGSIPKLVEFMIEHDEEHRDEMIAITQAPQMK